jgi:hypothetical protein
MIAGEVYFANCMTAARQMFGKSYFSLGTGEKTVVDRAVFEASKAGYHMATPEFLAGQTKPGTHGVPCDSAAATRLL